MKTSLVPNIMEPVVGNRRSEAIQAVVKDIYRSIRYDMVQPIKNQIAFRKRLSDVPKYDLENRDILFLTVDCLRNDHLSAAGYDRETTPFLDSLENYYPNCVSAASWTFSSVPSILSGLYPHNHGAVFESEYRNQGMDTPPASVHGDVYTLPEILAKAGYETYFSTAIVTAELPVRGRFKRADIYPGDAYNAPAEEIVDHLLTWWDSVDGPRFGYAHFGDLHAHLREPEIQPFGEIPDIPDVEHWDFTRTTEPQEEFEAYREARTRLYDTNLRYIDDQLQRLFNELRRREELEDTLIVIVGDHGEEFWERVELQRRHFADPRDMFGTGHGHALIPETLFVPLVIVGGTDKQATEWTSTTDIVPTILAELGLSDDQLRSFDGTPLQQALPDRAVLGEEIAYGYDQQAVVVDSHLLIDSPHENETVILDLETDELIEDQSLEADLKSHLAEGKRSGTVSSIDSQTQEHLTDLGYM